VKVPFLSLARTLASRTPGSTDVIVDVAAMERPHGTKMEDRQLGGLVSPGGRAGGLVVYKALQQSINGYALPLRFLADSRFGLWRDVEAHANSSLLGITVYLTPLSQLCHSYLPGLSAFRGWSAALRSRFIPAPRRQECLRHFISGSVTGEGSFRGSSEPVKSQNATTKAKGNSNGKWQRSNGKWFRI